MFQPGQAIYFKTGKRARKGTIIGKEGECYQVQACRTSDKFRAEVLTLPATQIMTVDQVKERSTPKGKLEPGHGSGLSIPVAESLRRQQTGAARLGMTEQEIFQCQAMMELRRRALLKLAACNGIAPVADDFEYQELAGEYLVAALSALRSQASKAPETALVEFRDHLQGQRDRSLIMITVARSAKTAAIRYLKRRAQYHRTHVDFSSLAA